MSKFDHIFSISDKNLENEIEKAKFERICLKILDLKPGCTLEQVKKAAKKACLAFHPDKNPTEPRADDACKIWYRIRPKLIEIYEKRFILSFYVWT